MAPSLPIPGQVLTLWMNFATSEVFLATSPNKRDSKVRPSSTEPCRTRYHRDSQLNQLTETVHSQRDLVNWANTKCWALIAITKLCVEVQTSSYSIVPSILQERKVDDLHTHRQCYHSNSKIPNHPNAVMFESALKWGCWHLILVAFWSHRSRTVGQQFPSRFSHFLFDEHVATSGSSGKVRFFAAKSSRQQSRKTPDFVGPVEWNWQCDVRNGRREHFPFRVRYKTYSCKCWREVRERFLAAEKLLTKAVANTHQSVICDKQVRKSQGPHVTAGKASWLLTIFQVLACWVSGTSRKGAIAARQKNSIRRRAALGPFIKTKSSTILIFAAQSRGSFTAV